MFSDVVVSGLVSIVGSVLFQWCLDWVLYVPFMLLLPHFVTFTIYLHYHLLYVLGGDDFYTTPTPTHGFPYTHTRTTTHPDSHPPLLTAFAPAYR